VLYLSGLDNGRRAPTSEIALNQHIPPSFLAKIVSQLSVAGVVQTSRGARGGVSLARAADEISLLEVVEAIDGPIMLNECVFDSNACVFGDNCPVQNVWCNAQETLVKTLSGTTFASLTPQ
jgi:Rrf2 family protein